MDGGSELRTSKRQGAVQREYLPLLDDWFRREHVVEIAPLLR